MSKNPPTPPSIEDIAEDLELLDNIPAEQLAEIIEQLAEKIISSPEEYKLEFGLQQIDAKLLDSLDLSTPAGRKKLAAILRILARTVITKGKGEYLSKTSPDLVLGGDTKGRGR